MVALTFADSHNMVAYMEKSEASADFTEIVDFLNASPISYALISSEPTNLDADKAIHKDRGDSMERAITTAAEDEHIGNINMTQSIAIPNVPFPQGIGSGGSPRCQEAMRDTIAYTRSERSTPSYDSPLLGVNTLGSDEERIELKELMDMFTKLFNMVLDLKNVKDAQALEIKNLGEKDASKQERNSDNIEELNVAKDEHMFNLSDLAGIEVVLEEEPIELGEDKGSAKKGVSAAKDKDSTADLVTTTCETVTTASVNPDDVTLAETLMAIRSSASRSQKLKGVLFKEPSEPTTITTSRPQP
ncbi:hypothetical protein Tco_0089408 [Tanacetum coccineum]